MVDCLQRVSYIKYTTVIIHLTLLAWASSTKNDVLPLLSHVMLSLLSHHLLKSRSRQHQSRTGCGTPITVVGPIKLRNGKNLLNDLRGTDLVETYNLNVCGIIVGL